MKSELLSPSYLGILLQSFRDAQVLTRWTHTASTESPLQEQAPPLSSHTTLVLAFLTDSVTGYNSLLVLML